MMQFFLLLAVLVTLASVYLVHQFWQRDLDPDLRIDHESAEDADAPSETLRAA